jgi:transcriptional regulator with XRE-family HTH domain
MQQRPRTRLEEIRTARGMTKAELARRSGVLAQTIQKIEDGGTRDVAPATREKLAPILGVGPEQLVAPIGSPIIYRTNERGTIDEEVHKTLKDILSEVRALNELMTSMMAARKAENDQEEPEPADNGK